MSDTNRSASVLIMESRYSVGGLNASRASVISSSSSFTRASMSRMPEFPGTSRVSAWESTRKVACSPVVKSFKGLMKASSTASMTLPLSFKASWLIAEAHSSSCAWILLILSWCLVINCCEHFVLIEVKHPKTVFPRPDLMPGSLRSKFAVSSAFCKVCSSTASLHLTSRAVPASSKIFRPVGKFIMALCSLPVFAAVLNHATAAFKLSCFAVGKFVNLCYRWLLYFGLSMATLFWIKILWTFLLPRLLP